MTARVLVIGCGSIGLRHLRNLITVGAREVLACDSAPSQRRLAAERHGVATFADLDEALSQRPEAVIVCTPTDTHMSVSRACLEAGAHVFIEKPISHTVEDVTDVIALAEERGRVLLVGHSMRFDPGLARLHAFVAEGRVGRVLAAYAAGGHDLRQWRVGQDYRAVYSAYRERGGGVLLDYLHDFDYLRWILGEAREVLCITDKLSGLEIQTDDHAVALLRMSCGALAVVQVDYLRRRKWRACEIVGAEGVLKWEAWGKNPQSVRITVAYNNERSEVVFESTLDGNEEYEAELRHFLACVEGREHARVPGEEGLKSLRLVLAAERSAASGQWVKAE